MLPKRCFCSFFILPTFQPNRIMRAEAAHGYHAALNLFHNQWRCLNIDTEVQNSIHCSHKLLWYFKTNHNETVTKTLSLLCRHTPSLFPSCFPFPSPPPSVSLSLSLSDCLSVCLSVSVSLSLIENLVTVLAYPPHHMFVILSVSYKFTCLTQNTVLLYVGMLSLIKIVINQVQNSVTGGSWISLQRSQKHSKETFMQEFWGVLLMRMGIYFHQFA